MTSVIRTGSVTTGANTATENLAAILRLFSINLTGLIGVGLQILVILFSITSELLLKSTITMFL